MCEKGGIGKDAVDSWRFLVLCKMAYFAVVINLNEMMNTIEKTEEKRRLTVERLQSSEEADPLPVLV